MVVVVVRSEVVRGGRVVGAVEDIAELAEMAYVVSRIGRNVEESLESLLS